MNSLLIILLYSGLIAVSVFISVKIVRGDPRRLPVAYALTAVLFGIGFIIDRMVIGSP